MLQQIKTERQHTDDSTPLLIASTKKMHKGSASSEDNLAERITQTGSKIKVHWSAEEVKESGWKSGWYTATVQKYCQDTDMLTVTYMSELDETYDEELLPLLSNGRIKLLWSPL